MMLLIVAAGLWGLLFLACLSRGGPYDRRRTRETPAGAAGCATAGTLAFFLIFAINHLLKAL